METLGGEHNGNPEQSGETRHMGLSEAVMGDQMQEAAELRRALQVKTKSKSDARSAMAVRRFKRNSGVCVFGGGVYMPSET